MITRVEAERARDELVDEFMAAPGPVVGVGLSTEDGSWVVAVDVTREVDLPTEIRGVPVRVYWTGGPEAYR